MEFDIKNIRLIDEIPGATEDIERIIKRLSSSFPYSPGLRERWNVWLSERSVPKEHPPIQEYANAGLELIHEMMAEEQAFRVTKAEKFLEDLGIFTTKPTSGRQNVGRTSKSRKKSKKKNSKKKVAQPLKWC